MCFWSWHVALTQVLALIINRILKTFLVPPIGLRAYLGITPYVRLRSSFYMWGKKHACPLLHSRWLQAVWLYAHLAGVGLTPHFASFIDLSRGQDRVEGPSWKPWRLYCSPFGDFSLPLGEVLALIICSFPFSIYCSWPTTLLETKEKVHLGAGGWWCFCQIYTLGSLVFTSISSDSNGNDLFEAPLWLLLFYLNSK